MTAPQQGRSIWMPIFAIMLAVSLWCVYLAIGAYRMGHDVRKPVVILAAWLIFVGFWSVLLIWRYRRTR